jgi:hypothetical protein
VSIYWIDSGVLIGAKNTLYAPELVPVFWTFIEAQLKNGNVRMPKKCFDEVTDGNDWLAKWCKQRKNIGHFCCKSSSREVQDYFATIAAHVIANNSQHSAAEFLKGGDGWVMAHAAVTGGFVVTEELRNKYKSKVKIPTLCKELHPRIPWKATHEMCKELGGFGNG